ncbi:hypothetical protein [Tsukamurella spumae]|uniref:Uncharacterized protein n=1 Tax=Tsukamurella spumae TaxID=44753 RepID=A0A846X5M0_9ACTN|nr:hypothetical protein [Tsukamurella spumae]NKY19482.1 hypothetical protein [Tsukamurella spumae]
MTGPAPEILVYHLPPSGPPQRSAAADQLDVAVARIDFFMFSRDRRGPEGVERTEQDAINAANDELLALSIGMTRGDIVNRTGREVPMPIQSAESLAHLSQWRDQLGAPETELDHRMDSMIQSLRQGLQLNDAAEMEQTLGRVGVAARRAILAERVGEPSPIEVPERVDQDLDRDTRRWFNDQMRAIEGAGQGDVTKTIAMLNHNHLPHRVVDVRTAAPHVTAKFREQSMQPMVITPTGHEWYGYQAGRIRQVATEVHGPDLFSEDGPRRASATAVAQASFSAARFAAHRTRGGVTRLPASAPQARSGPSGPTAQGRPTSLGM